MGVGGAAHPDELLGRLTVKQWREWQAYARHYLTPMQRADINAAMIRRDCGQWKKVPDLTKLVPKYGKARRKTDKELKEIGRGWHEADKARANRRKGE